MTIPQLAEKIEQLIDRNDHTTACLALAEFLGDEHKCLAIMKHIKAIHEIEGSMPYHVSQYRHSIKMDMLTAIRQIHGIPAADLIESSF